MARHFQASRISRKGNVLFPDELIIDNRAVTYRKFRSINEADVKDFATTGFGYKE